MEGKALGRKVRGMLAFDAIHMYEGGEIYKIRDALIHEQVELVWYAWVTRYKDGSFDFGHFMLGHGRFGFSGPGNENSEVEFSYDVNANVDSRSDGYWQQRVRFSACGGDGVFTPDPRGRLLGLGSIDNPQMDGRFVRVGDTREPHVSCAWGEAAPGYGSRPINRIPGVGTRIGVNFRNP